jgi:hypothetical protein
VVTNRRFANRAAKPDSDKARYAIGTRDGIPGLSKDSGMIMKGFD